MFNQLRDAVLALLEHQCIRMTPSDLRRHLRRQFPHTEKKSIQSALKLLVDQGDILFTNHFNTTHIELNLNRPKRMTSRIVLSPSNCQAFGEEGQVVIKLCDGAAFGTGDHPTTRLMLRGIDVVMGHHHINFVDGYGSALDIGAGTGILSIAAVGLGMSTVMAVDTDPMACAEAEKNIQLNHFQDQISVFDAIQKIPAKAQFDFIFSNLRPPTLLELFPTMRKRSSFGAVWVLSGFRPQEQCFLENALKGLALEPVWEDETCGWSAMAAKSG